MPWKASSVMEKRLRFVARLLDGEAMTDGLSNGLYPNTRARVVTTGQAESRQRRK